MEALKEIAQHVTLNLASGHQIWIPVRVAYTMVNGAVEINGIYAQNEYKNEVNVILDVLIDEIARIQSDIFFSTQQSGRDMWQSGRDGENLSLDWLKDFEAMKDPILK
jgi:hypothetical protein